jgi:hypothetical protein
MPKTTPTRSALLPYKTGGRSLYEARQTTPSYTPQRRATIDPSLFKGKKAASGAPLASRPIEAPIQETGPEAMSITDGEASTQPQMITETQQPIENRGDSARYMIQGGGPRIDLSFLVPERVNKAFDPSKAIGGENVPYQESTGVGGFFRRLLGDESNRMNIEAQQAQGAEWREAEKEAQKEERLLNRMREADKPTQARFEASQQAAREAEAARVAAENKRLELEGKRVGLTEQQIADARQDRIDRLQAEKEERDARIEEMRTRNAIADATFGLSQSRANQPSMTGLPGGGLAVMDPRSGSISIVNPGTAGFGEKFPGTAPTTRQVYPQPKAPVNTGGAQVNRVDGSTMGGPLPPDAGAATPAPQVTPPRSGNWPAIGEVKPDVSGLYYTAEPFGSGGSSLKETGAFDVPPSVAKQMSAYAMSPEQKMNILKNYQQGLRASRSGIPRFAE